MKASCSLTLSLVALLATTPVVASPAIIVAAAALATGVGASASRQPYETWQYTTKYGWVGGAREDVSTVEHSLPSKSGTSEAIVGACRDALRRLARPVAEPFDVASIEAVEHDKPRRANGRTTASLDVRAMYRFNGVHEVTRSKVRCVVDRAGNVISIR